MLDVDTRPSSADGEIRVVNTGPAAGYIGVRQGSAPSFFDSTYVRHGYTH